ncbi:MAG: PKD domain-containing protein [Acidimicrobiales bacterium]
MLWCPSVGSPQGVPQTALPAPPSAAEAAALTPFPVPSFGLNPQQLGLSGLASWFWARNVPSILTSTSSVRGYIVVTTAEPVKYYWYFGDGGIATSSTAGTQTAPSAIHTYQSKSLYTVTLTVAWQGQYTFSGNGVPTQTVQLGTVDQPPATTTYRVQEIRSVLVTPTS